MIQVMMLLSSDVDRAEDPSKIRATLTRTYLVFIFNQQDRDALELLRTLITEIRRRKPSVDQLTITSSPESQQTIDAAGILLSKNVLPQRPMDSELGGFNLVKHAFTFAAFCRNEPFKAKEGEERDLSVQTSLSELYALLDRNQLFEVYGSIEEAVALAKRVSSDEGDRLLVLVTGSLHLVGGLLQVLGSEGG